MFNKSVKVKYGLAGWKFQLGIDNFSDSLSMLVGHHEEKSNEQKNYIEG